MKQIQWMCAAALAGGLMWNAAPAWAQHQHQQHEHTLAQQSEKALKVGEKDEVTLDQMTLVGDLKLEPGRYRVQHRVEGSDHFVRFTEITRRGVMTDNTGEAKCRLEPLDEKVAHTSVFTRKDGDGKRVTKLLIGGEKAAHLFDR